MSSPAKSSTCTKRPERASAAFIRPSRATCRLRQARSPASATCPPCCPPSARSSPRSMCGPRWAIAARSSRRSRRGSASIGLMGQKAEKPSPRTRARSARDTLVLILAPGPSPGRLAEEHLARRPWPGNRSSSASRVPAPAVPWRRALSGPEVVARRYERLARMGSNAAIKDAVRRGLGVVVRLPVRRSSGSLARGELVGGRRCGASVLTRHFYASITAVGRSRRRRSAFLHFLEGASPRARSAVSGHKPGLWPSHRVSGEGRVA